MNRGVFCSPNQKGSVGYNPDNLHRYSTMGERCHPKTGEMLFKVSPDENNGKKCPMKKKISTYLRSGKLQLIFVLGFGYALPLL